jgi:hypothetical protein
MAMHVHHYGKCTSGLRSSRLSSNWSGTPSSDTRRPFAAVEETTKENLHVAVNDTVARLDMSHGSAHHIVHDFLQFHKYLVFNKLINI